MELPGVDGELGLLAYRRPVVSASSRAMKTDSSTVSTASTASWATSAISSFVSWVTTGGTPDAEVGDDVRAEGFAEIDLDREPPVGRRIGLERRVLDVLGADADDHRLALVRGEARALLQRALVDGERVLAEAAP